MTWGSAPQDATAGKRVIADRYELREKLGAGGMGAVWAARDVRFGREVAVKEAHARHGTALERVVREATAAMRVNHPSVVTVHDVVEEDGNLWIVMERVRGESLAARLGRDRVVPEAEAARIGLALAEGLRAAHAQDVLHRDLKPANVLLGSDGRVVLTDFGIADIVGDTPLTGTGEVVGSRGYIAPERWRGERAGAASDLWALGVLLFEMVEGWSPYRRETMVESIAALLEGVPEPRRATRLGPLITRLLADDPARRPAVEEAVTALRQAIGGPDTRSGDGGAGTGTGTGGGTPRRSRPPRPGRKGWVGITAAAATTAAATLLYGAMTDHDPPSTSPDTSASPRTRVASPTASKGPLRVREAAFTVDIPSGYTAEPRNADGQYVYTKGQLKIIVTGGRDKTSEFGDDPMAYQRDREFELQPYRDTAWGTSTDLRTAQTADLTVASGTFTWRTADGEEIHARNAAMVADGRYHVVLALGPESRREEIGRLHDQVVESYEPGG